MFALDAGLLPVARFADAQVRRGADAVVAAAVAHRHASRSSKVRGTNREAAMARALIQTSALAVETRKLADRLAALEDAPPEVGIVHESGVTDAAIGTKAAGVRAAVVLAMRLRLWAVLRFRTPSGHGVHRHSVVAETHVRTYANTVDAAAVSTLERVREGYASPGVWVQLES